MADAVAEVALRSAGGPLDLLGHSLGGAVGISLARRWPGGGPPAGAACAGGIRSAAGALAAGVGIASEGFLATRRALGRPLAGSALARRVLLFGSVHDGGRLAPDDARFMLQASSRARRLRAAVEEAAACDLSSVIAEVRAPVGAIRGERDQVVSAAAMRALVAARPDTVEESIADSGHVPQLERPGEFVSALERVLDGLTAVTDS